MTLAEFEAMVAEWYAGLLRGTSNQRTFKAGRLGTGFVLALDVESEDERELVHEQFFRFWYEKNQALSARHELHWAIFSDAGYSRIARDEFFAEFTSGGIDADSDTLELSETQVVPMRRKGTRVFEPGVEQIVIATSGA